MGPRAVIVGTSAFFYFRNWSEERALDHFVTLLKQQKYQEAYQLWQTPDSAKFYPPEKFAEDWGPIGPLQKHRRLAESKEPTPATPA